MRYRQLKLEELRENVGLDYAAFTYQPGKCSCCYGPLDLRKKDWSPKAFERAGVKTLSKLRELKDFDYTYIQFANSSNGSGIVNEYDNVKRTEYIRWNFPWEKMDLVIAELQKAFGEDYEIIKPKDEYECIIAKDKIWG